MSRIAGFSLSQPGLSSSHKGANAAGKETKQQQKRIIVEQTGDSSASKIAKSVKHPGKTPKTTVLQTSKEQQPAGLNGLAQTITIIQGDLNLYLNEDSDSETNTSSPPASNSSPPPESNSSSETNSSSPPPTNSSNETHASSTTSADKPDDSNTEDIDELTDRLDKLAAETGSIGEKISSLGEVLSRFATLVAEIRIGGIANGQLLGQTSFGRPSLFGSSESLSRVSAALRFADRGYEHFARIYSQGGDAQSVDQLASKLQDSLQGIERQVADLFKGFNALA